MLESVIDQLSACLHTCFTIGGNHVKSSLKSEKYVSNLQSDVKFIVIILFDKIQPTQVIHV
jgi:hypothetical protein